MKHDCKCENKEDVFIVSACRTPIGMFGGGLRKYSVTDLGGIAIKEVIAEAGIRIPSLSPKDNLVNYIPSNCSVIIGNVLSAGLGQAPARQAMYKAGLPWHFPAVTVNKVCGSGLWAVIEGYYSIKDRAADMVIAGGMESMTNAPYLIPRPLVEIKNPQTGKFKQRLKTGDFTHTEARELTITGGMNCGNYINDSLVFTDSIIFDGLRDPYNKKSMSEIADMSAKKHGISRRAQDDYAKLSNERAIKATQEKLFSDEIVFVGDVAADEGISQYKPEKMKGLPSVAGTKTITAANASKISDGVAALVLASSNTVKHYGLKPMVKIIDVCGAATDPLEFPEAPCEAINALLRKNNLKLGDIDLWEINEAFALVPLIAMKKLKIPYETLNVHGGAVALGHPIGASGARILVTLIHAMKRYNKKLGVAAICIGGGEALAVLVGPMEQ